ncbi:hypothetical protein M885DRAFT_531927 [Pelagophyceae sp. CCMP2097]|nr:hypothetical protein M885DRAFT_531927 [Pelagophyceae sp. CCMP2097]|mmetsp:Transcript_4298/g.15796  ORF Transcript_4298/g.15796 Transcript_4298/m.15796 type:complete len:163 (+) Transcript_4298:114-602(+)
MSLESPKSLLLHRTDSMRERRRSITWDEAIIAEHDLLRGTRQKIDEPDTPFCYSSEEKAGSSAGSPEAKAPQELATRWDDLTAKLETAAAEAQDPDERVGWVAEMEEDEKRADDFAKKRSGHYNEFQRLQEWRDHHQADDDDKADDDDDSDGDLKQDEKDRS